MEFFLTNKGKRERRWEIPVIIVLVFFGVVCIFANAEEGLPEKDYMQVVIGLLLAAACLIPGINLLRGRIQRRRAVKIARQLAYTDENIISFRQLANILHTEHPETIIDHGIGKGYLRNMELNFSRKTLELHRPMVERDMVQLTCSACGAKLVLERGTVGTCEYCDSPITDEQTAAALLL